MVSEHLAVTSAIISPKPTRKESLFTPILGE